EEHLAVISLFPVLEPGALLPAERAVTEIRQIVEELEIGPGAGALAATVSLTGEPVLALEEMETVVIGAGRAGVISLVLVALILGFGLRSLTLIASVLFTLVTGLVMTAGLAAVVVGSLNLISVAFAVLFVGLAVDFGIHYSLRYREALAHAEYQEDALIHAGGRLGVGIPLSLCMLCTIIGFLSFLPTSYRGLAELGQIAALGMGVAFIGTITLLPALLSLFPAPSAIEIGSTSSNQGEPWFEKQAGKIVAACLVLTLVALPVAVLISFDVNPLNLRDPESQSVETFNRLAADPLLTPYRAQLIAESPEAIGEFADDAAQSDEIGIVISALSFIPEQQDTALDALFDLGFLLGPSLDGISEAGPLITTTSMREGLLALSSNLNAIPRPMPGIDRLMAALEAARPASIGSDELLALHDLMARFLYPQLTAIGASLDANPITLDDLPAEILRDWRGKEGGYRVDVLPATPIASNTDIRAFAEAVAAIEPEATGTPAIITAASDAIAGAFVQATLITLALITLVLVVVLRSLTSVTLALLPLVQAAVLAIAVAALAGQALNFANIIALPLLFALGVCSCIHMVWRQKQAQDDLSFTSVQQTTTPRAITLSAITTVASFGTLATSPHPGTASMGLLLTLSIAATLFTTLIFLPAAMAWLAKRKQQQSIDAALARHIGKQRKGTAKNEDPQP
ncbi:MAG: MMPL family transporter, partial [Alphaproteobacteria bacterium]|nr:MMPL family transporter [Alphaproteobacteria bacterium SS10]